MFCRRLFTILPANPRVVRAVLPFCTLTAVLPDVLEARHRVIVAIVGRPDWCKQRGSNKYTLNASHASLRNKSKPPLPLPNITLADHALRGAGSTGHDGWPSSAEARPGRWCFPLCAPIQVSRRLVRAIETLTTILHASTGRLWRIAQLRCKEP